MPPHKRRMTTHRTTGFAMAALAVLLLGFALPQATVAWLTVPENMDHTRNVILSPERAQKFAKAMQILPQPATAKALAYAAVNAGPATTLQRGQMEQLATTAITLAPGDPYNWYYLAAALENQIFEPTRLVMFDQALTMSLMTGPHTRDLILSRAMAVVNHWDKLSQPLRDDWQDQIISLWASSPNDLRSLYLAMPPEGKTLVFATLDEIPGESLKFNRFLDHPDTAPAPQDEPEPFSPMP